MFYKDASGEFFQETLSDGLIRKYRRRRVLGRGGFAKCYEVTEEATNLRYACKVIDKELLVNSQLKEKLQTEIEIHRKMNHKNIVKFERLFQDEKYIYFLLELCINNTLNQLLKRRKVLSEVQVRFYMYNLLEGLLYLHRLKVVHRDLKLDNFFITDDLDIKIGDFGLAARITNKTRHTICGTPNYIAPQILQSKNGYSYEVDVWSMGITAYLLLYGHYPFECSDTKTISSRINSKTYLINPYLSDVSKSFIGRMLQVKPHDRATVKQLLQHEFITYFQIPKNLPRSSLACPLSSNFLDQYKIKKQVKIDNKEDEQFNFMLESRESPSSPRGRHSSINHSMSASKILQLNKKQKLPYIFSQKKMSSFHQLNEDVDRDSFKVKPWLLQWWQQPKVGLFYQVSDSSFGMRFNDGSNLKAFWPIKKYNYISKTGSLETITARTIKSGKIERQLAAKLKVFTDMIVRNGTKGGSSSISEVYVKFYLNTLDGFLLILSNGTLQCRFSNLSELIIGKQTCMYISPNKIKIVFEVKRLEEQSQEIIDKQQQMLQLVRSIKAKGTSYDPENTQNVSQMAN